MRANSSIRRSSRRGRRQVAEINVVPYIDVMLVLLVIFMITAPLLRTGVDIDLPDASANPIASDGVSDEPLVLSVDADAVWYLNVGDDTDAPQTEEEVFLKAYVGFVAKISASHYCLRVVAWGAVWRVNFSN